MALLLFSAEITPKPYKLLPKLLPNADIIFTKYFDKIQEPDMLGFKHLILGDVARYSNSLYEAWIWYEKAYHLYPLGSKPHCQLALLSLLKHSDLDVLYYNCLSLGNLDTSKVPKTNLLIFLDKLEFNLIVSNSFFLFNLEILSIL